RPGRMIEDYGEVGRRDADRGIARVAQELPQHVAEAGDGPDRQAVGLARQGRQRMIRAENVARPVDEEEVVAFLHGATPSARSGACPWQRRLAPNGGIPPDKALSRSCYKLVIF